MLILKLREVQGTQNDRAMHTLPVPLPPPPGLAVKKSPTKRDAK